MLSPARPPAAIKHYLHKKNIYNYTQIYIYISEKKLEIIANAQLLAYSTLVIYYHLLDTYSNCIFFFSSFSQEHIILSKYKETEQIHVLVFSNAGIKGSRRHDESQKERGKRRGGRGGAGGASSVRTRGAVLLFYTANSCDIRRNKHG